MRSFRRKLMLGISLLVLIFMLLFVVVPYLIAGPPTPLFTVRNHDNEGHELRVEIYDSENNSVLDETYELAAGEEVYHPKPFRFRVPGFEIVDYTFKFTLDNMSTETYSTNVQPWNTVEVELYADYAEGQPISIGEISV
ncbi:hypothetical protein EO95_14050 [Methanosarcina sp. 1.H.T.1A.1]|uniref:hypothetical protein n=1 Tax=unclassified Methanosarcina TaxID=2644672 RepID=UPI000622B185|nr:MULTISPECIES: hypothetical protein [unclassified Methanosarcina]KKG07500.1 hypothetical protein EO92_07445 [Methanosarcina sp. 2.H.A.1B.4]KKI00391.1 hypothetical protein EO95_14050 [Methanosarcina sp. 1.H.T.1A.1]